MRFLLSTLTFQKAFDRVPHFELLKNVSNIGVGVRILEGLFDYLMERKEYAMVEKFKRDELEVTTGVSQGSLLGPLLSCFFIDNLPDVLKFSEKIQF